MAVNFRIRWEPIDFDCPSADPTEAATWGSFWIEAVSAGAVTVLTRRENPTGRVLSESVQGPVIGIAEWLASAWPHVVGSRREVPESAPRRERYLWARARRLRMAGDGLALPNLEFGPAIGEEMAIRWRRDEHLPEFARVRFLEDGTARVRVAAVRDAWTDFMDTVVTRLRSVCPGDQRARMLFEQWRTATDGTAMDHRPFLLAGRFGLLWSTLRGSQKICYRST